jgi:hypothetical protein
LHNLEFMQTKVFHVRQFWAGSILLSTALSSSAITLGAHSGAGVLGRPLDIRVQAILAPGEELADACVNTDVLYGETKLPPSAVKATLQRATPNAQALVRIQASVAIDEPVVTVVVRAGCTAPFTRRYVLLADPVSEPARSSAAAVVSGALPVVPRLPATGPLPDVSSPGGDALPEQRARATSSGAAASGAAETPRAAVQQPVRERAKPPAVAFANRTGSVARQPAALPAPAATPRLELDAIDLSPAIEHDPVLKLSLSLLSEPTSSPEVRAAAGRLWRAVNSSPEDILLSINELEALSAAVSALRDSQTSSQATISEISSRLEQSRQWQWLVIVLVGLLALALLGLVWMWRQQKNRPRFADKEAWWVQEEALNATARDSTQPRRVAAPPSPLNLDRALAPNANPLKVRPVSRLVEPDDSKLHDVDNSTPVPFAVDKAEFLPSQATSRSLAAEELIDVQQQADFFISLGQDEQAIKLLRDHIAESQVPSALTYLDLLAIHHRQGNQEAYEQMRVDFNGLFNAGAPAFDQFSGEGRSLESYERAMARIQALWPKPRVLDVIEQSIFREVGDPQAEVFDLEAYRELLLLYALAKEMIQRDAVDSKLPKAFANTQVHALKTTAQRSAAAPAQRVIGKSTWSTGQQPPVSPNLGLDVNLNDWSASSAFEVSLPDVDRLVEPNDPAARRANGAGQRSNSIDFELFDIMPPDEGAPPARLADKKR